MKHQSDLTNRPRPTKMQIKQASLTTKQKEEKTSLLTGKPEIQLQVMLAQGFLWLNPCFDGNKQTFKCLCFFYLVQVLQCYDNKVLNGYCRPYLDKELKIRP